MADRVLVTISVNGTSYARDVEPRDLLVYFLREDLGLTGTHVGCDTSQCGACTVLVDNRPVKSCTMFAVQADGKELRTVEGLATNGQLHPLQQAVIDEQALQCGYCYNGLIIKGAELLSRNAAPTEGEIRAAMDGHLCRCGTYPRMMKAIQRAARLMGGAR